MPRPRRSAAELRPDVQGLRAIAVGAVLLYHLLPDRVTGGFVGVDVFFVVSGFLIGCHLLRELETTGRIRLGRFWARRAKRLLPASLLVLLVVVVVTLTVLPLSERGSVLAEVAGSALHVQNWVLADQAVDYLAADDAASPVQHYWTLSVEEQFFVLLPLVLALVGLLLRRPVLRRRGAVVVLAALAVASLAYSVHLTSVDPRVAYLSTGTRAWEFLVGVLLAALAPAPSRLARHVLGWAGLAAVLVAVATFDGATAFPGWSAALPVLGTAALLAAADAGPVALVSRWRPVTWLGDVSYGIYLWHWPLVVLVPHVTGVPLRTGDALAVVVASVLLAWASTRLVEDPVRYSPRLLGEGRTPAAVGAWLIVATCLVAWTATGGGRWTQHTQDQLALESSALVAATGPDCLGVGQLVDDGCGDLGDVVLPDPGVAARDDHNDPSCWSGGRSTTPHVCSLPLEGAPASQRDAGQPLRVLAIGDSHNNALLPAWEELQERLGWQVDVTGRGGCSWSTVPTADPVPSRRDDCSAWRADVAELLASSPAYDVVVTTALQSGYPALPRAGETSEEATVRGLQEAWRSQIERGAVVVAIEDNPRARVDVVACVEREGIAAVRACANPLADAVVGLDVQASAVAATPGSALVRLRDLFCDDRSCAPVIGNVAVYRDQTHLTATFVRTLAPVLVERVQAAVAEAEASAPR